MVDRHKNRECNSVSVGVLSLCSEAAMESVMFEREMHYGILVLKFLDKELLGETKIKIFRDELFACLEKEGYKKIILDWSRLEYVSSAALNPLITMNRKMQNARGKFVMCCMDPEFYRYFFIAMGLNRTFWIKPDLKEVLEGF